MKVAQLLPYDIDYHGGVREVVFHLSRELESRGHETTVFAPASGTRSRPGTPRLNAIETRPVALPANGSIARVMGLDHAAWSRLLGAVRDGSFDVVHLHEPALWLPLLFSRREPTRPTYVGTFHAAGDPADIGNVSDLIGGVVSNLVEDLVQTGEIASLPRWRPLVRSVESRRRGEGRAVSSMSRVIALARPVISSLLGRLDTSVAVSRTARDFAASYGVKARGIIPNGVDVAAFGKPVEKPAEAEAETRPTVLFFSRLDERKGLDTLMDAMPLVASRVPDVRLVVAGNFAMIDDRALRYQALAVEREIDVGFVPSPAEEAKIRLFRSATMLCAPALGQESFGIVLAEALAAGLPIVASDLTSFRDVLDDGALGLLTPPGDQDALAAAIVRMLTDEALRRALSNAGRVKVRDYAWDVVADRTLGVYQEALTQLNGPLAAGDGLGRR